MFCSHQVVSNQCVCWRRKQRTHLYSGIAVIFCRRLRSLISWFSNKYNDFFPSTNTTISFPFNQQIQRFVSIFFGDFNSFGMSVICWWYSADSWFSWTRYERYRSSTSHRQMHWAANLTHRKSLQSGEMDSPPCHQNNWWIFPVEWGGSISAQSQLKSTRIGTTIRQIYTQRANSGEKGRTVGKFGQFPMKSLIINVVNL